MSVPSAGWNVARGCNRPLRSSAQPRGVENPEFLCRIQIWPALTKATGIMRSVIKLARQCQRFTVPLAIENPEKSLCWMTSQLQELS